MKLKLLFLIIIMILLVPTVLGLEGGSSNSYSTTAGDYYLLDNFVDTDGTVITSHTANTGQTWGSDAGTQTIQGNALYYPKAADQRPKISFGDPDFNLTCEFWMNMSTSLNNNWQIYFRNGGTESSFIGMTADTTGDWRYNDGSTITVDASLTLGENFTVIIAFDNTNNKFNYSIFDVVNQSGTIVYTQQGTPTGWVNMRNGQTSIDDIWLNLGNNAGEGFIDEIACWNVTDGRYRNRPTAAAPPPVGATVNDTIPVITITNPVDGSTVDNSTYLANINGTITVQNDTNSLQNPTINSTEWKNQGNKSLFNFTFNGSTFERKWVLNISSSTTHGNESSSVITFTVDLTPSVAYSSLDRNVSLFYAHYPNMTFQINITDENMVYSLNVSTPEGFLKKYDNVNTTKYIFNGSINITDYGIGKHNVTAKYCDAHTDNTLKVLDWSYNSGTITFFNKYNPSQSIGLDLGYYNNGQVYKLTSKQLQNYNVVKYIQRQNDRFNFGAYFDLPNTNFIFGFRTDQYIKNHLDVIDLSIGHFVLYGKFWIDFILVIDGIDYYPQIKKQENYYYVYWNIDWASLGYSAGDRVFIRTRSIGELNCGKKTWLYYIFNYTATYSTSAIETETTAIDLSIIFKDIVLNGNGTLNYNSILYNTLNTTSVNQLNLTLNLSIPGMSSNETNVTFFWNVNMNDTTFATINYTQLIQRIQLVECGGTLTDVATLNMTIFKEITPETKLNADVDAAFYVWTNDSDKTINYTFDLNGDSDYSLCIFPNTSINVDARMTYNSSGGYTQRWYLENARFTTNASLLYLYNFDSTTGVSDLRGTLRKTTYEYFPNIITQLQRFYPSENVWRTVQMDKSDDYGQMLFHVIEGSQDYRLNFLQENTLIDSTGDLKFLCTSGICAINFIVEQTVAVTGPQLSYSTGYSNISEIYQLNWTDTTGLTNSVRLVVTKETGAKSKTICDTTVSSSSGTINCDTTGHDGMIKAIAYSAASPELPFILEIFTKTVQELFQLTGIAINDAALWATGISSTFIIGAAVISPILALIVSIFSLIIINMIGLLGPITVTFIGIVGVMAVVIAVLLKHQSR